MIINAQEGDPSSAKPIGRHEVSLSLNPLMSIAVSHGQIGSVYCSYKYHLKKINLRTAIEFGDEYTNSFGHGSNQSGQSNTIHLTDSNIVNKITKESIENESLRFGIETTKENKWVQWVFGSDLLIGLKYYNTSTFNEYYDIETGKLITDISAPLTNSMSEAIEDEYLLTGVTLSFGVNLKISRRISTGILLLTDGYYGTLVRSNNPNNPGDILDYKNSIFLMFNVRI